ncbi:MAG TPA: type II secretion system protein [Pyrinomonadaceae bacterium]|nr:type II secretion system protein [Pyrinomonadaceae bacterium]
MKNQKLQNVVSKSSGFSLLELLIALTITLAMMAAASTLLATSLRTRTRENQRSNALAAAQRALNIMSREIGNSGYGLTDNGIVVADSDANSIRVRANLDNGPNLNQTNEDVRFVLQDDNDVIVRVENAGTSGVLATGITSMTIEYHSITGTTVAAASAERVHIDIQVALPASPQQPAALVRLTSDVALRNAPTTLDQF